MKLKYGLCEKTYPHILITPHGTYFNVDTPDERSWQPQSIMVQLPEDPVLGTTDNVSLEELVGFYINRGTEGLENA